jgi:hypothetical protein
VLLRDALCYQLVSVRIQLKKPIWAYTECGMHSSRRYSVKRHIRNTHGGGGDLVSYTDYLIGRKSGIYLPSIYPTYIPKNKDSRPHYMDICKDELLRCTIRNHLNIK